MNKIYLTLGIACFCQIVLTMVPLGVKATQAAIWTIGIARLVICVSVLSIFFYKNYFQHLKRLWPLGLFFFLHWATYAQSVKVSTPSTAIIGLSFYGMFLLIYSQIFLKQKVSKFIYLLILLSITTVYLTFSKGSEVSGILWGLGSASTYAILPIINKKNSEISHGQRAFIQFSVCLIFYILIGLPQSNWNISINDYWILLGLGLGGTVIGHGLWVKVTTELPTEITSGIYYLVIPFSFLLENLFLGISINHEKVLGSIVIILSNLLILIVMKRSKFSLSKSASSKNSPQVH